MTEENKTSRKAIVAAGAAVFFIGLVLSWPGGQAPEVNVTEYGLQFVPEEASIVAWGTSEVLKPQPEAMVWPHAQQTLALHRRAFEKLGIPMNKVDRVVVAYSLNSNPAEMVMVLTGSFDENGLLTSTLEGDKATETLIEQKKSALLAKGYVMVPVGPGQVVVGNTSMVERGIQVPREEWAEALKREALNLPEGFVSVAMLAPSFHLPGLSTGIGNVGVNNGLWLEFQFQCDSPEKCDRFPAWLEFHLKGHTPGVTVDPDKTNAFLSTVNLKMEETGGRLSAGTSPKMDP